jgi:hypothetical protein
MPEVDFSKEMVVVAAMGEKPSSDHGIIIDGACDVEVTSKCSLVVSMADVAACNWGS